MNYDLRLQSVSQEYNQLLAQLQQPLSRLSFLQGQIDILMSMRAEDEAAKKAAASVPEPAKFGAVPEPTETEAPPAPAPQV